MKQRLILFFLKFKISLLAILKTYKNYKYIILSLIIAFLFFEFLYWFLNGQLFMYLMGSGNLSILDKINLITSTTVGYFQTVSIWQSSAVVILSILQGIVIGQIIYILKNQNKLDEKAFGGSAIASVIALFSVGCPSCGTSIITPVLSIFVSGASVGLTDAVHEASIYIGLLFAVYALYSIGQTVAGIHAKINFS